MSEMKSELILAEANRLRVQKKIVDVEEARVKVVLFTLGEDCFALYGEKVREILPPGEISWLPGVPEYIRGLINVRGDIESVIDIRHFLRLPPAPSPHHLIVLAMDGEFRSGILVDSILDVVDVPASGIRTAMATLDDSVREFVLGELDYRGRVALLLDVGAVFTRIAT